MAPGLSGETALEKKAREKGKGVGVESHRLWGSRSEHMERPLKGPNPRKISSGGKKRKQEKDKRGGEQRGVNSKTGNLGR